MGAAKLSRLKTWYEDFLDVFFGESIKHLILETLAVNETDVLERGCAMEEAQNSVG